MKTRYEYSKKSAIKRKEEIKWEQLIKIIRSTSEILLPTLLELLSEEPETELWLCCDAPEDIIEAYWRLGESKERIFDWNDLEEEV